MDCRHRKNISCIWFETGKGGKGSRMKKWICLLATCLLLPLAGIGEGPELSLTGPENTVVPWEAALILFTLPEDGTVDLVLLDETGEERFTVAREVQGKAGQNSLYWNGTYRHEEAPEGTWRLSLQFGQSKAETMITVGRGENDSPGNETQTAEETGMPKIWFTPASTSPYDGQDSSLNYWTLPMDIREEEKIWSVLTAPITVVENGKGEKAQVILRAEPSQDSPGVGTITCTTQGVHVLKRGEEWSLIECYSSSFHDSPILNWNTLVQGYVPTSLLTETVPSQEMGLVIDKLTQRLYIFREGHLFTTLAVSTGLSNKRQPYNETRSGEFLLTSKVGDFRSDNLTCAKAIRFNKGDLLHEVPYILREDGKTKDYSVCEAKLGTKASHGCIRVQRKENPEGVNMYWIWSHLRKNSGTRLLIWEDWQGRQIETPPDDFTLYYNPVKGRYYHSAPTCRSAGKAVLQGFSYGQLEEKPFDRLKRCEWCAPVLRKAEIEEINAVYAFGGDHDPVLTKARENCPRPLK